MATTTPEPIRDRIIAVIAALTPTSDSSVPFRAYRNEGGADFQGWAEANTTAALRRFQVRLTGSSTVPEVSNTDYEEHTLIASILIAYPQFHRWGAANALDRDDVMDQDAFQVDKAVGMLGGANFTSPHADACWQDGAVMEHVRGQACDFVQFQMTYTYKRTR